MATANYTIWRYEDAARRRNVPNSRIAELKRDIDRENQCRNDLIDTVAALLRKDSSKSVSSGYNTSLNSETPGNIIDRPATDLENPYR